MPLFNNNRDSKLVRHFQKEMVNEISSIEISFYKLIQEESRGGIYMEMNNKSFANPVRIHCTPKIDSKEMESSEFGIDSQKNATFSFLPENLNDADVRVEEGDIIEYDDRYYQASKVSGDIYWSGRNYETSVRTQEGEDDEYGTSLEIRVECYSISDTDMNIKENKTGTQKIEHFGDYTNLI